MVKCAGTIEPDLGGILANASLPVLNRVFSEIKRKARVFRSTNHLTAMVYFSAGKLRITATR